MFTHHALQAAPTLDAATFRSRTRGLLIVAALAGPFFYVSSLVQALAREGFDIRAHPLSQLATGEAGWVQQVTFVVAGCGAAALAVAHHRIITEGAGWRLAPVFIGTFGAAFAIAGLFPMDPQNGFPAGAPAGAVAMSWHSIVHSSAAAVSFLALAGACITLLIRAVRRKRVWASIGNGAVALILLLPVSPTEGSIQIAVTGLIAFSWVTVTALRLGRGLATTSTLKAELEIRKD